MTHDLSAQSILALRNDAIEADATGIAILSAGPDHHFLNVNKAFEQITGYPACDLVGRSFETLTGPRTSREGLGAIQLALDRHQTFSGTIVGYRADGIPRWVDLTTVPSAGDDGQVAYVLLTIRDATSLVRAGGALELIRELGAAIRRAPAPADASSAVVNLMVPTFTDWCAIHLLSANGGLKLAALAHASQPAPVAAPGVDVGEGGIGTVAASGIPLLHQRSEPQNPILARQMSRLLDRPVHAVLTVPIASDATHIFGAMTWAITDDMREFAFEDIEIAEDIGARLGYSHDAYRVRQNLSQALDSREAFLSAAGHELRTPVVSIKGYAQLLLRDIQRQHLSPQRLENALRTIVSSASRLSTLTEDLFSVYNRGSATVPLSLSTVKLETYLREFFTTAQAHLLHGHTLDLSGIAPAGWVSIDVTRFAQVLYNLMDNAQRFSPPTSKIRITTAQQSNGVLIAVSDAGSGLKPGEETAIFDPFYASRHPRDHAESGLGISLYISQQIVQRHDGQIWAESDGPNRGATFKILLPRTAEPAS
jgi:PAS domain S-box-containing protein